MICEYCQHEVPEHLLSMMFVNGAYHLVDPECALAIKNKVHGTNFTEFHGTIAQQMLEDYRAWKGAPK